MNVIEAAANASVTVAPTRPNANSRLVKEMCLPKRDYRDGARGPEASPSKELPGVEMRGETQEYAREAPAQTSGQDVNWTA